MTSPFRGLRRSGLAALLAGLIGFTALLVVPQTATGAPACGKKLAVLGALTGDAGALGRSIANGATLAAAKYNEQHPGCEVEVVQYDSQGVADKAIPLANAIVADSAILGVVGPAFSGESLSTGATFAKAGLATITPSATNPAMSNRGWKTFHRLVASDTAAGALLAGYIRTTLKKTRVAVVSDGTSYGATFARAVRTPLGRKVVLAATIKPGQKTFTTLVKRIKAAKAQAVVFGGYFPEGGLLAKQLARAGVVAPFLGGDGIQDPYFAKIAGAKVAGRAHIVSGTAPPTLNPGFSQAYRARYGAAPRYYALEGYDATRVLLAGLHGGATTRAAMLTAVDTYNAAGLTKPIRFSARGDLVKPRAWVLKPAGTGFTVRKRLG